MYRLGYNAGASGLYGRVVIISCPEAYLQDLSPRINLRRMATTAMISKTWIMDPRLMAKYPMAQRMIRTTAMMYSKLLMVIDF